MMGNHKRGGESFVIKFFTLLIFTSCFSSDPNADHLDKHPVLECIMDSYIVDRGLSVEDSISIIQTRNWDNNFSHMHLMSEYRPWGNNPYIIFETTYKGYTLFYSSGSIDNSKYTADTILPNAMISNMLNWKPIKRVQKPSVKSIPPPPETFNDFYFRYSTKEQCIRLMNEEDYNYPGLFSDLKNTCPLCKE